MVNVKNEPRVREVLQLANGTLGIKAVNPAKYLIW